MKSCLLWGALFLAMLTVAFILMAFAWGVPWGVGCTVLLLVSASLWGDGG